MQGEKMTGIHDMLNNDQVFKADFCSDTTIARLRGAPTPFWLGLVNYPGVWLQVDRQGRRD